MKMTNMETILKGQDIDFAYMHGEAKNEVVAVYHLILSTILPPSPSLSTTSHSKQDMQQVQFLCSCC